MFSKSAKRKPSFIKRMLRSVFSVVVLTGFVLGISFVVKQASAIDPNLIGGLPGDVAGEFAHRLSQTKINRPQPGLEESLNRAVVDVAAADSDSVVVMKVAVLADSHNEFNNLQAGVNNALDHEIDFLAHLGDLSDWGDVNSLQRAYNILSSSGVSWFAVPGDRDLAQSIGRDNFISTFKTNYAKIEANGYTLLFLDNAALNTPLEQSRLEWFLKEVRDADYIFLSQPLWHQSGDRIMGVYNGDVNVELSAQRDRMLEAVRNSNVKVVFGGHHHRSDVSIDPVKLDLEHAVVGALVRQRNVQLYPRFTLFTVYEDGAHTIEDIVL